MSLFRKNFKSFFVESITPSTKCAVCGADVFDNSAFCPHCLKKVVFNNGKTCKRCGVALHGAEDYCSHCVSEETFYDRCFSPLCYGGNVRRAVLNMKFNNNSTVSKRLAFYLADCVTQNNIRFDIVTFVPMTKIAEKRRGYNQARLLAADFCDILHLSAPETLLFKVKETVPQEKLGKKERRGNIIGAFAAEGDLSGKTILVIDDLKTTGATLNECARALKKKGAQTVFCLTVASREEKIEFEQPSV